MNPYQPRFVFGIGDGSVLADIPSDSRVEIIAFPGEDSSGIALRPGLRVHTPRDIAEARILLRRSFTNHVEIVTLSSALILKDHPLSPIAEIIRERWAPELERRIAEFIEDLGNDPMDTWAGALHAIRHGSLVASAPTTDDLLNAYSGLPAICLGAGPSAEAELETIARCQGQCVIFATDAMLTACNRVGIVPDFVCAVERIPATLEMLRKANTGGTTLLAPLVVSPSVVELFGGRVLWYWRPDGLEKWVNPELVGRSIGNSCGTQSVAAAIIAGCSPIYLVGHDLCCDIDGHTHAASADELTIMPGNQGGYRREPTVAADGRAVHTTPLWREFQSDIEYFLDQTAQDQAVYNVGRGLALRGSVQSEHLPDTLGPPVVKTLPTRTSPGSDPSAFTDTLLLDCRSIQASARTALESWPEIPETATNVRDMVDRTTADFWADLCRSLYSGIALRMYHRPTDAEAAWGRRRVLLCLRHLAAIVERDLRSPAQTEPSAGIRAENSPRAPAPPPPPTPSDWTYLRHKVEESDLWFTVHRMLLAGDTTELLSLDEWQLDRLLGVVYRGSSLEAPINRILKEYYGRTSESYGGIQPEARPTHQGGAGGP